MFRKTKFLVTPILLAFIINSCNVKSKGYCYNVSFYSQDSLNQKRPIFTKFLFSFEKYLFEFNYKIVRDDTLIGNKIITRAIKFDTVNILILDPEKRIFHQFRRFSKNSNLITTDLFSKKPGGIALTDTSQKSKAIVSLNKFRDTVLWGKQLSYFIDFQKNSKNVDSIITHVYCLKDRNFISLYELMSGKISDEFKMIGFTEQHLNEKFTISGEIENFRLLSKQEQDICNSMLKKIK